MKKGNKGEMQMAQAILLFIIVAPLGVMTFLAPREMMMFGQRWQYEEEPLFTEEAILWTKIGAAVSVILVTIVLLASIVQALR